LKRLNIAVDTGRRDIVSSEGHPMPTPAELWRFRAKACPGLETGLREKKRVGNKN
jgi:hypothetical protein